MTTRTVKISVPDDVDFSDLHLSRDRVTGDVMFDMAVVEKICTASGLDAGAFFAQPEDAVCALIVQWYDAHLARGGAPDAVAEELIDEVRIEDGAGQQTSHKPGRA